LFARAKQRIESRAGRRAAEFCELPHSAKQGRLSRLLDRLNCAAADAASWTSAQQLREAIDFPPSSRLRSPPGAAASGSYAASTDLEGALHDPVAAHFADESWCRILSRARPRSAVGVLPRPNDRLFMPIGRSCPAWAVARRSAEREAARRSRASRKVGHALDWHGALSIDYIIPDDGDARC